MKNKTEIRKEALESLLEISNAQYNFVAVQAIQILVTICDNSENEEIIEHALVSLMKGASRNPDFQNCTIQQAEAIDDLYFSITNKSFEDFINY